MTPNDQLAAPTVSSGGATQPTDTYDSQHGTYVDPGLRAQPQSFPPQTSHVKSTFSTSSR